MALPISRTEFNRLGERLAASDDISAEDDALLERCLSAYDEVKELVRARLGDLGYAATARTKTTGTLVEKLRREQGATAEGDRPAGAAELRLPRSARHRLDRSPTG